MKRAFSSFLEHRPINAIDFRRIGLKILGLLVVFSLGWHVLYAQTSQASEQSSASNLAFSWQDLNPLPTIKNFLSPEQAPTSTSQPTAPLQMTNEEAQVIEVAKRASQAVVSIVATNDVPKLTQCAQQMPDFNGMPLPQEFQRFFNVPTLCQNGTEKKRVGAASGFLVSDDGYIVTNKHVVENESSEYTVILNDAGHLGQKYKATVLARDPENDIAVLKIDGNQLPFLSFGDSSKLQVGQTAIAIGYALGEFDNTVSRGVVSGLLRSIQAGNGGSFSEQLRGLIQTDAAINPGNSGGPLLDSSANVIGMNTAVANAQSIGFAIPSNEVQAAYDQVRKTGKLSVSDKAFLGVRYIPINEELQSTNKLPFDYGMLIQRGSNQNELAVMPGSPADKAGIQENDIILEADGKQLNERYLLSDAVSGHKPDETINFKIYHRGETKTIQVKLEKRP